MAARRIAVGADGYGGRVPEATARITLPDRYTVVRHIANGGMASVWEAYDELLARRVAVKLLAPHLPRGCRRTRTS
jgi:serine/threonine-protein kinase